MQTGRPLTEDSSSDPYPDDPKGVGGWLAFVIVMLMVLNPLLSSLMAAAFFGSIENDHPVLLQNPVYVHYKWSTWGAIAVFSLISIAAGYTLWKKHVWKSVRWVVAAIWLIGPFSSLVTVLIAIPAAPLFVEFGENLDVDFYPSFLWSIIWTSFLLRSKRVRNTYRRDDA